MYKQVTITLLLAFTLGGCGDDGSGGESEGTTADATTTSSTTTSTSTTDGTTGMESTSDAVLPPAAPTELKASILDGGVHLTWKDAADNEDNYVVENKVEGGEYTLVIELPFDSVTYHDTNVTAATSYTYRVKAVNAGGEAASNEVMVAVP